MTNLKGPIRSNSMRPSVDWHSCAGDGLSLPVARCVQYVAAPCQRTRPLPSAPSACDVPCVPRGTSRGRFLPLSSASGGAYHVARRMHRHCTWRTALSDGKTPRAALP